MKKLPLLLSVPHAGLQVPPEAEPYCRLTPEQVAEDGDVGAAEIYDFRDEFKAYESTEIARAIIDQNREPTDRRKDGVVKTHTCWEVPVYDPFPPQDVLDAMLRSYYFPYHRRLTELGESGEFPLAVDCHTMAAFGPPVGPDPGQERPQVCLSNGEGTCSDEWINSLKNAFQRHFEGDVAINTPFRGGYITRNHAAEMPWVQLEISRAPFATDQEKRRRVLAAITDWCEENATGLR